MKAEEKSPGYRYEKQSIKCKEGSSSSSKGKSFSMQMISKGCIISRWRKRGKEAQEK